MKTFLTPDPLDNVKVIHYGNDPPSNPWVGMLWVEHWRPEIIRVWSGNEWIPIRSSSGLSCKVIRKSSLGNSEYYMSSDDTVLIVDFDVFDFGTNSRQVVYLPSKSYFSPTTPDRKKVVVVAKSRTSHPMATVLVGPVHGETIDRDIRPISITAPGGSVTFVYDGNTWVSYQKNDVITGYYYQFQPPATNTSVFNALYSVNGTLPTSVATSAYRIYYIPAILNRECEIKYLGVEITTPASGNFYIGLYTNGSNDLPDRLIYSLGPFSSATSGLVGTYITTTLRFPAGALFWVAVLFIGSPGVRGYTTGAPLFPFLGVSNNGTFYTHMFGTGTTLPNPANATSYGTGNIPLVYTRFSYL